MIFNWNINDWIVQYAPQLHNKADHQAWIQVLLSAIKTAYNNFIAYRADTNKRLRYNSQQIVLSNLLNDMFDLVNRGIYIETQSDLRPIVYLFVKADNKPIYLHTKAENKPFYLYTKAEYSGQYDFIVTVPAGILTAADEIRLKATVKTYKHGAKRPLFKYTNGNTF